MLGIKFFHASTNIDSMDCSASRLLEKARVEVLIVAVAVEWQGRRVRDALLSMWLGNGGWDSTPTVIAMAKKATMEWRAWWQAEGRVTMEHRVVPSREDDGEEGGGNGKEKKVGGEVGARGSRRQQDGGGGDSLSEKATNRPMGEDAQGRAATSDE
ncbi:hypothetical protein Syun_003910 [Stephania yunnanensis]|uniref:Uncharacterized protein n=1 Tax=Stephania yunnanensis TaxID=152371 RepID=A0AAP0L3G3_9MAGN